MPRHNPLRRPRFFDADTTLVEKYVRIAPVGAPGECWNWVRGPFRERTYGRIFLLRRGYLAHRVAYEIAKGAIPDGLDVLHSCHNRRCVNPAHLRAGTHEENMRDMVLAGRSAAGGKNSKAKITSEIALAIQRASGSRRGIAGRFGVAIPTVRKIQEGRHWTQLAVAATGKSDAAANEPSMSAAVHDVGSEPYRGMS